MHFKYNDIHTLPRTCLNAMPRGMLITCHAFDNLQLKYHQVKKVKIRWKKEPIVRTLRYIQSTVIWWYCKSFGIASGDEWWWDKNLTCPLTHSSIHPAFQPNMAFEEISWRKHGTLLVHFRSSLSNKMSRDKTLSIAEKCCVSTAANILTIMSFVWQATQGQKAHW